MVYDNRGDSNIKFTSPLNPQIFNEIADISAREISEKNTSTQVRKFYEEFCMLNDKIKTEEDFKKVEPMIRMINSKVAYANGRKNVDECFKEMMKTIIKEVKDKETMNNAKLFFEAVVGFLKSYNAK